MVVVGNQEISISRNRAVAEFIVIGIRHDHAEAVMGFDLADVAVKLGQQFQQCRHLAPAFAAGEFDGDLLVFQKDFSGNRKDDPTVKQGPLDAIKRLFPAEHLEKDAGIQANRHA